MIQVVEDTIAVEQIHPLRESMIHPLAGDRHRLAVADHVGYRDPGQHIGGTNAEKVDVPAPATVGRGGVQAGRDPARQDVLIAVTDAAPDLGTPDTAHHRLRVENAHPGRGLSPSRHNSAAGGAEETVYYLWLRAIRIKDRLAAAAPAFRRSWLDLTPHLSRARNRGCI